MSKVEFPFTWDKEPKNYDHIRTATVQDCGMENEVNLCDSCSHEMPNCKGNDMIFGTGKGNDNVASCSQYDPLMLRHPKHNGCGDI